MASRFDRIIIALIALFAAGIAARGWLHDHPQHDPWVPLTLDEPPGLATSRKLARLRGEPAECRAFLNRSGVALVTLPSAGSGACRRADRVALATFSVSGARLSPRAAEGSCALEAGLARWLTQTVQPAARRQFGSTVSAVEHYGTFQCRRIGNDPNARWSEHATANAIDVSGLILADGRRIAVKRDWPRADMREGLFLREIRDGACASFATVLSPDYNAAHRDHLHLDQEQRMAGFSYCR